MAGKRYSQEAVDKGLIALAANGGRPREAAETLRERYNIKVSEKALEAWKNRVHVDRYRELRDEFAPIAQKRLAEDSEDIALALQEKNKELLERFQAEALEQRDIPQAARNLATAMGIHVDKLRLLREQSTANVKIARNPEEVLDEIQRIRPDLVYDAEVEEDDPPKELEA